MCFPEDDLPRNVLLSEFTETEIDNISDKAGKLFCCDLEELINDIEFKQSDLIKNIHCLVSSINEQRKEFASGILVKQINSFYRLISNPKELVNDLKDYTYSYKFFSQILELSEQIDLCLLKVLFDLTKVYESLYFIPLAPNVVLKLYAKSCEVAMKLVSSDRQKNLKKCQNFFSDSSEWMTSQTNEWPSKMKKKYPHLTYEINCVKKLIKREKIKR